MTGPWNHVEISRQNIINIIPIIISIINIIIFIIIANYYSILNKLDFNLEEHKTWGEISIQRNIFKCETTTGYLDFIYFLFKCPTPALFITEVGRLCDRLISNISKAAMMLNGAWVNIQFPFRSQNRCNSESAKKLIRRGTRAREYKLLIHLLMLLSKSCQYDRQLHLITETPSAGSYD